MITGDNPLTAVHVAKDVEIVDRDVMILDLKEGTTTDGQYLVFISPRYAVKRSQKAHASRTRLA